MARDRSVTQPPSVRGLGTAPTEMARTTAKAATKVCSCRVPPVTQTQNKATLAAALKARQDVDDDDIPEIIGIAQELQSQAADEDDDLSVEEVEDVARELGIDPKYVEEAIAEKERRALAGKAGMLGEEC